MIKSGRFFPQTDLRLGQILYALLALLLCVAPTPAIAAKVLVVGDIQYSFVADIVSEIQLSVRSQVREYAFSDIRGGLAAVVEREDAQVVLALGMDAVAEAMRLPPGISIVYGLVVSPPGNGRGNVTGVYMSPPVTEYVSTLRRYLPTIGKVAVIGSNRLIKSLMDAGSSQVSAYPTATSSDVVAAVNRLSDAGAVLLLPDANLLTASVMEKVFLYSFRTNTPLLGISESHVKNGALFAYVFDPKSVSRQIADKVNAILNGTDADEIAQSPPRKYNLYVNANTARKMGLQLPEEMLRKAKKVYR